MCLMSVLAYDAQRRVAFILSLDNAKVSLFAQTAVLKSA